MKRPFKELNKSTFKRVRRLTLLDRIWSFLQRLPGISDLISPENDFVLPSTQSWTRSCPDVTLRCPGCNQYLEAPVKQCTSGHSVCALCQRRFTHCPSCRKTFLRTPQPVLDKLLTTTRLPCVYAAFGCPVQEVLRRRDSHSRICIYRPSVCPLCPWESPPRLNDRLNNQVNDWLTNSNQDQQKIINYGEEVLGRHLISAHKHHYLVLNKEHILSGWLEPGKLQTPSFLSCALTVDDQVFVFVMNYDPKRKKFLVVLKHVSSLTQDTVNKTSIQKKKLPQQKDDQSESPIKTPDEISDDRDDSFESTDNERIFGEPRESEFCYLVELTDNECVQSVRLVEIAMSKDDPLDAVLKSGRSFNIDITLIDRILAPGNGHFKVKLTIAEYQSDIELVFKSSKNNQEKKNSQPTTSSIE